MARFATLEALDLHLSKSELRDVFISGVRGSSTSLGTLATALVARRLALLLAIVIRLIELVGLKDRRRFLEGLGVLVVPEAELASQVGNERSILGPIGIVNEHIAQEAIPGYLRCLLHRDCADDEGVRLAFLSRWDFGLGLLNDLLSDKWESNGASQLPGHDILGILEPGNILDETFIILLLEVDEVANRIQDEAVLILVFLIGNGVSTDCFEQFDWIMLNGRFKLILASDLMLQLLAATVEDKAIGLGEVAFVCFLQTVKRRYLLLIANLGLLDFQQIGRVCWLTAP